jgi:stage V sporulation protein G
MAFTITRFVLFENEGALKAFCDVCIDGRFLIKGIRVVEGRTGPFISMPRQQNKDGKWFDSVVPLTKEAKTELSFLVLNAYRNSVGAPRDRTPVYAG